MRLLNEVYLKEALKIIAWYEGLIGLVTKEEIKVVVKSMKTKKVVKPDRLTVEIWTILKDVMLDGWKIF
jgi:hypothetical protein